ncbi:LUD domain-containing protein [Halomicrobium urmianum]|uniref:LUD domain-containing protein n=1 Tax=Halomicrobium urmianum TaxID=1586233 RepID=UPI001CD9D6C4|nr:LUD domain-containing protein [Halomicrobium urmianum]
MSTSPIREFERSLHRVDATSSVVEPDGFDAALADAVEEPAVGAPLPFEDLSLADHPVALDPSPRELREARTGVTGSRLGIASLGTVAVESRAGGDELTALFPEYHVVVLRSSDVRPDLRSAFAWLADEFDAGRDSLVFETGPSATGDMGALVQGVHGPEAIHVLLVDDE